MFSNFVQCVALTELSLLQKLDLRIDPPHVLKLAHQPLAIARQRALRDLLADGERLRVDRHAQEGVFPCRAVRLGRIDRQHGRQARRDQRVGFLHREAALLQVLHIRPAHGRANPLYAARAHAAQHRRALVLRATVLLYLILLKT